MKVREFRGVDNLVIAEITTDDDSGYETGAVESLAPVAEISKTTETSSATKYYDNIAASTINSEGSDEITIQTAVLDLATQGKITGKAVDTDTGALVDGQIKEKYFALGYRFKLTDGTYRYIWRHKGKFSIPDETSHTEDDSTDTNNMTLTFTGIYTTHKFTKPATQPGPSKGIVVDESDGKADVSGWFDEVITPDTIQKKTE